ncbi:MAG: thioredoxin family protein [Dehalococcoidia bacterium]
MIPLNDQQELRDLFGRALKDRVKIEFFTQRPSAMLIPGREECQFCKDVEALLHELVRLSPLLNLAVHELGHDRELQDRYGVERVPATVIRGVLNRPVSIYGVPLGTLFTSLVETLVLMSQNKSQLPAPAVKRLKRLHAPVKLLLFVSPESPYCAPMVTTAFACAIESKFVKATVIEVAEFPRLAERYQVKQVPFTVLNERAAFPGVVPPEALAEQIVKAATSRTISVALPRSQGASAIGPEGQPQAPGEVVRPSGLIIPGR